MPDLSNLAVLLSREEYADLLAWLRREAPPSEALIKRMDAIGFEIVEEATDH